MLFLTQKLLPLINNGGRIVNLSTPRTRVASAGGAVYASMELGPRKIAVYTVAPGAVATDFSGGVARDNPEVNKRIAEMTALGRVGLPEDLGR